MFDPFPPKMRPDCPGFGLYRLYDKPLKFMMFDVGKVVISYDTDSIRFYLELNLG
jgi:hypothetical protein